ncbi:hypothetical protein [Halopiger djelfimassiliensis]|uniref:hypothetical protein n=1 Tax=Halopiger djelfimassiliensis TaxID=1293047 RepID=UPI001E39CD59|nr:hypothetical protein [Halopiger djelfimassiliensis]
MSQDSPSDERNHEISRRTTLGSFGTALVPAAMSITGAGASDDTGSPFTDIRVTGKQVIHAEITADEVVITKRKRSSDLVDRYGMREVVEERTISRRAPERDDLPRTGQRELRTDWETHHARGDEWATLFESEREALMRSGVADEAETPFPSAVPKYYHAADSGGYELHGPVNLLSNSTADADALAVEIDGEGGLFWNTFPVEYSRHMYIDGEWTEHEASVASGPFGIVGRTHARLWSGPNDTFGIAAAHIDDAVPHEATSYLEAESEITDMMDGTADYYEAGNGEHPGTDNGLLDHNGAVSLI